MIYPGFSLKMCVFASHNSIVFTLVNPYLGFGVLSLTHFECRNLIRFGWPAEYFTIYGMLPHKSSCLASSLIYVAPHPLTPEVFNIFVSISNTTQILPFMIKVYQYRKLTACKKCFVYYITFLYSL